MKIQVNGYLIDLMDKLQVSAGAISVINVCCVVFRSDYQQTIKGV
jgi:hypothetical protein